MKPKNELISRQTTNATAVHSRTIGGGWKGQMEPGGEGKLWALAMDLMGLGWRGGGRWAGAVDGDCCPPPALLRPYSFRKRMLCVCGGNIIRLPSLSAHLSGSGSRPKIGGGSEREGGGGGGTRAQFDGGEGKGDIDGEVSASRREGETSGKGEEMDGRMKVEEGAGEGGGERLVIIIRPPPPPFAFAFPGGDTRHFCPLGRWPCPFFPFAHNTHRREVRKWEQRIGKPFSESGRKCVAAKGAEDGC
ncbi:hypothetical protein niasHT_039420 [Heterodera trifolii]|uniref:Uncharacterized protein n=1 Tax=Heterodera trifolii TaxID=157864 RepID=A0ABD2J850_9BILA